MALLCALLMMGCLTGLADDTQGAMGPPERPSRNAAGMPLMPNFTLHAPGGETVSLADYYGKQVVLYFWASWCPSCKDNMAEKQALHDLFAQENMDAVVLAINLTDGMQETRASCDAYVAAQGYTMQVLYEETGALANGLRITSIPVTLVIDAEGYAKGGVVGPQSLEDTLALLAEEG